MVAELERLAAEVAALRAENAAPRAEGAQAVTRLQQATAALGRALPAEATPPVSGRGGGGDAERTRDGRGARRRVTPAQVTPDLVRAVLVDRGPATAGQIAAAVGARLGTPVSGRAMQFLAERLGASTQVVDGERRYVLSGTAGGVGPL